MTFTNGSKRWTLILSTLLGALGLIGAFRVQAAAPAGPGGPPARMQGPAPVAPPCCVVSAIDARGGLVAAREPATGRTFQFGAPQNLLSQIRVGQKVWVDSRTQVVSVEGAANCCRLATNETKSANTAAGQKPSIAPPAQAKPGSIERPRPGPVALAVDVAGVGPQLSVRGQQAVLTWRAEQGSELRVNYGPTSALGRSATGRAVAGPPGLPTYEAILDGLQTGRPYYYSAVLSRNAAVVSQTDVRPFSTPHVLVRVRPHRLDIVKDGDRDINGTNKGEARFSWRVALDPMSMTWPDDVAYGGCYPGGGTWTVGVPTTFTVPLAKYGQNPPGHNPAPDPLHPPNQSDPNNPTQPDPNQPTSPGQTQPQNPYYPPGPMVGCVEDSSNPWSSKKANTVKVKSGQVIELRADAHEWVLPDGMPLATTVTASASTHASRPDGSLSRGGAAPAARRRPANRDTDTPVGGSDTAGASAPPAPPTTPCEIREPRSAVVAIYAGTKGYEIDEIYNPTGPSKMRIRTQVASGSDVVCFDLREPNITKMLGVKAKQGNFQFTTWFQVELLYRP